MTHNNISVQNMCRIAEALLAIESDDSLPKKTSELRLNALGNLTVYLRALISDNDFLPELIDTVCIKKIAFIMQAETVGEIREIMKPPRPVYSTGRIECPSTYHIDEEELLMWARLSPNNNLVSAASDRYMELFEKVFGFSPNLL